MCDDTVKRPVQNGLYYATRAENVRFGEHREIIQEASLKKVTHMIVEKEEFIDLLHAADLAVQYIRVIKERANADRELRPKKAHSGYVLLWQKPYTSRDRGWQSCWQTPFNAKMPHDLVQDLFSKAFKNGCDELLDQLGEDNKVSKTELRANYQKGYWEITLTHAKELVFPESAYDKTDLRKIYSGCYEPELEEKMTKRSEALKSFL